MDKLTASRINGGNPERGRKESDFYPTPKDVMIALLDVLFLDKGTKIWEPACGENDMVDVMEEYGYQVIGTNVKTGQDFLTEPLIDCDWIITNPPFSLADKFIERCAEHGKPFALLLKSQYWHVAKRFGLFCRITPQYVLPLTWRPNFLFKEKDKGSPLMDVMWCVWNDQPHKLIRTIYVPLTKGKTNEKS